MLTRQPLPAAILACAAISQPHPAHAAEQVLATAPGSSWNVDNGDERCQLAREFGDGGDRVTLLITQWAPGSSFQMALAGQPLARFEREPDIRVAFGEVAELGARVVPVVAGTLEGAGRALIFSNMTLVADRSDGDQPADAPAASEAPYLLPPAAVAAADRIEVSQDGRETLRLQAASFANALTVLTHARNNGSPPGGWMRRRTGP